MFNLSQPEFGGNVISPGWFPKANGRIRDVCSVGVTKQVVPLLSLICYIKNSGSKLKRFSEVRTNEDALDLAAECYFALIFEGLDFAVAFEPTGARGPDLLIERDGKTVYVDVTRFRPTVATPGPPSITHPDESLELEEYGNVEQDIAKVRSKFLEKLSQIREAGGDGIVAFWNDNDRLEELEHDSAIRSIQSDLQKGIQESSGRILFAVFRWGWTSSRNRQELFCVPLTDLAERFRTWCKLLESSSVQNLLEKVQNECNLRGQS